VPSDYLVTRQQARELDRIAIEQYGIKGLILMENAGRACAREALDMLGAPEGTIVAVLCGTGNNGGDGFVIARHLSNAGCAVEAYLVGEIDSVLRAAGDAAVNLEIALNMGIPVKEIRDDAGVEAALDSAASADLIADALLGTGASGEVRGLFRPLIEGINAIGAPVLAVDVPSGLDCDTGEPLGVAVRADRTITFVLNKRGFPRPAAEPYVGRVGVAEISVPRSVIESKVSEWSEQED